MDMLSGITSHMSSWMGRKTETEQPLPINPEDKSDPIKEEVPELVDPIRDVVPEEKPATEEGGRVGNMFASVKSQMSTWLPAIHKKDGESGKPPSKPQSPMQEEPAETLEATNSADETGLDAAAQEAKGLGLEEVSTKAIASARTLGSFFASAVSKAGETVKEAGAKIKKTVEETPFLTEFSKEQEAFIRSKNKSTEAAVPCWVGYADEENLKEQILSLSTDRRNFLRSPPSGANFQFDYDTYYPVALATLAEDSNLEKMRYELVPKLIKEEDFWRNYFYRVNFIRQSTELSSLAQEGRISRSSSRSSEYGEKDPDDLNDITDSPVHEFVSDAYQTNPSDMREVQEGMKRIGVHSKQNDEDWERELQAELQDFELESEGSGPGHTNNEDKEWEKDIDEILAADELPSDLK